MPLPTFRTGRTIQLLRQLLCLSTCIAFLIGIGDVSGADESDGEPPSPDAWQVSADRIDYDQTKDEYTAAGHVAISREGRTLTADSVRLNQKTREAFARGNVRLTSGQDVLSGDRLTLNLDRETGTLTDGTLYISKNHLYLSGHKIQKTGPQTYAAEKILITSCEGSDPAWRLTGQDLKVTIEGYGYAKNTALWAGKIPVLYSPLLVFPVKLKRQSGLLMPEFGYSDRKGSEYLQPLYWAINDNSDATLYAHYMTERGLRSGLEYRYVLDENALGSVFIEGLQDYRIDDGLDENSDRWGYEDDEQLRTNKDRYWIRAKHDQPFASGLSLKLDVDVVSDQDYLYEFKSGYNGFTETQRYFRETFGRDIDDFNDPVRVNRLNVNRTWTQYSFNTDVRWNDDVIKRRIEETDDTLHQLPAMSFDGTKQPIGSSPLYFDLASGYSHFYRINGTRGHRLDLYPRVYYPLLLWQALSVEPSAGLRQTAWQVDRYETRPDHGRETLYRAVYDLKLDVSTEFSRVFNFKIGGSDRLKHAVIPEVIYAYTPEEDQGDFPWFDELDRIARKNLITYGFTNILTARAAKLSADSRTSYTYTPFLRFKLLQSFDINKDREGDPEPFSAVTAELDLTPGRYVELDSDAQWSPYDSRLDVLNTALRLWDARGDKLSIDYRYTRETSPTARDGIETLGLDGEWALTDKWRVRAGYEYNFFDDKEIETSAGVSYQSHCWGVDIDYSVEEGNKRFGILFNLVGLGSIGG